MARIAILVADMYEDSEFRVPYDRLREAGHEVVVVGTEPGATVHGKRGDDSVEIERSSSDVTHGDFEALVIPGGYSPDKLRTDERAVAFTRAMVVSGRTVAAICHGGWMLAEADVVQGMTLTSWPSIKTDLVNAGATWVNEEVTVDTNLITSRKPEDLDAFCDAILHRLERVEASS